LNASNLLRNVLPADSNAKEMNADQYHMLEELLAKKGGPVSDKTGSTTSWLESTWLEWLEANRDNPNQITQYVAASFRKILDAREAQ